MLQNQKLVEIGKIKELLKKDTANEVILAKDQFFINIFVLKEGEDISTNNKSEEFKPSSSLSII